MQFQRIKGEFFQCVGRDPETKEFLACSYGQPLEQALTQLEINAGKPINKMDIETQSFNL